MNIVLPLEVNEILDRLSNSGYAAYVVGGCVRDSILGLVPHDWDICTSAKPDEMMRVFKDYKIIETGLQHGTITVMLNHIPFEITTYRIDGEYSDNRRPDSVEFTTSLYEDLSRRDFTINAMAYNPKVGLVDPFQGLVSLNFRIISCVGDPNQRFNEDALRILRAIRFSIQLEFMIDDSTLEAMMQNRQLINNISAERINAELMKMLGCNKSIIDNFHVCRHIIAEFIPELAPCFDFEQNNPYHDYDVYGHTLHAVDSYNGNDVIIKLSLLLHDIGKPSSYTESSNDGKGHFIGHGVVSSSMANDILRRLKFDNETIRTVTELILYHDVSIEPTNRSIKKWLNRIGEVQLRRLIEIRIADILAQSKRDLENRLAKQDRLKELLDTVINEQQCFMIKDLAVNGDDLINIGFKPGVRLGMVLQELLDAVIVNEVMNDKDKLLQLAREKEGLC